MTAHRHAESEAFHKVIGEARRTHSAEAQVAPNMKWTPFLGPRVKLENGRFV
jgi:hypothetical protein